MKDIVVLYNQEQVSVPKEVADFLEQDRKRAQAQDKQDERHLSKGEFETVLTRRVPYHERRKILFSETSCLKNCIKLFRNWMTRIRN